jgi:energy-coupling factor transporter ATP-binding protein EcfA2
MSILVSVPVPNVLGLGNIEDIVLNLLFYGLLYTILVYHLFFTCLMLFFKRSGMRFSFFNLLSWIYNKVQPWVFVFGFIAIGSDAASESRFVAIITGVPMLSIPIWTICLIIAYELVIYLILKNFEIIPMRYYHLEAAGIFFTNLIVFASTSDPIGITTLLLWVTIVSIVRILILEIVNDIQMDYSACVGKSGKVLAFRRGIAMEFLAIARLNAIKQEIDAVSKDLDGNRIEIKGFYDRFIEFFKYKWNRIVGELGALVSMNFQIMNGNVEFYIIIKKRTLRWIHSGAYSAINSSAEILQTMLASDLGYILEYLSDEEFDAVSKELLFPRRIDHPDNLNRVAGKKNRKWKEYFTDGKNFLRPLQVLPPNYHQARSFENYRTSIVLDQILNSFISSNINSRIFINCEGGHVFQYGPHRESIQRSRSIEGNGTTRNGERIEDIEFHVYNIFISVGAVILSKNEAELDSDTDKAHGIFLAFWECQFFSTKGERQLRSMLSSNQISHHVVKVPTQALFRFFHFPTKIMRGQGREFLLNMDEPPESACRGGEIYIGNVLVKGKPGPRFTIGMEDIKRHVFVTGTTGSGKSTFVQHFLQGFYQAKYDIPFLLLEVKGEYTFLKTIIQDLEIYQPGTDFSLNLFKTNGDPRVHAERVFDILKSSYDFSMSKDFSPQMEKMAIEVIAETCSEPDPADRNFTTFFTRAQSYIAANKSKIPYIEQTWIGIENRIRRISTGPLKKVFDAPATTQKTIEDVLGKRALINAGNIIKLGGSKEDVFFFANVLFKYIWDQNIVNGPSIIVKHVTVVDDAQYFYRQPVSSQISHSSYFEDMAMLLRGTGEALVAISTRPDISGDVIANCGLIACFQTKFKEDVEKMQGLLHLSEAQSKVLEVLPEHTCVVRTATYQYPFILKTQRPVAHGFQVVNVPFAENTRQGTGSTGPIRQEAQHRLERAMNRRFSLQTIQKIDPESIQRLSSFVAKVHEYSIAKQIAWDGIRQLSIAEFKERNKELSRMKRDLVRLAQQDWAVARLLAHSRNLKPADDALVQFAEDASDAPASTGLV